MLLDKKHQTMQSLCCSKYLLSYNPSVKSINFKKYVWKHGGLGYSYRKSTCIRDLGQPPHKYPGNENLVNPVLEKSLRTSTSIAASWFMTLYNVTLGYHKWFRHMQPSASDKILIPARMSYSWKDLYFFLLENFRFLGLMTMAVWDSEGRTWIKSAFKNKILCSRSMG